MGKVRSRTLAVIATATLAFSFTPAAASAASGEVLGLDAPGAIKDSYVVVFKQGSRADTLSTKYQVAVEHTYRHALQGFAGRMSERAARRLAAEPGVAFVEQNREVHLLGTQTNPPSWGLNRIDQRNLPWTPATPIRTPRPM